MKIKRPSFQFYPNDWANDNNLKLCSLAAQGLWIKILCVLHDSDVYGKFCYSKIEVNDIANDIANIKQGSNFCYQLARLTGESENVIAPLLNELINSKVPKFDDEGFMYSKRMMKDERIRRVRQEAGSQGGKKHWRGKNSEKTGDLFAKAKPIANLKQTVEDEDEEYSNTLSNTGNTTKGGLGEKIKFEDFWNVYDKKVGKQESMQIWEILEEEEKQQAIEYLPKWKIQYPDKKFRLDPANYLEKKRWNDEEVITSKNNGKNGHHKNPQDFDIKFKHKIDPRTLKNKPGAIIPPSNE